MPSPFLRSDKTLIKIAQEYIDAGFVDIPDDEVRQLIHFGINMKRLSMIMTKLLKLNKAIEDVKYSPYIGPVDPVISDTLKNEFKELNRKYKKSPLFNVKRPRRSRVRAAGPLRRGRSAGPPSSDAGPSSFGARLPTRRNVLRSDQKEREEAISRLDSGRGPYNVEAKLISIGAVPPHLSNVKIDELRKYFQRINFLMSEVQSRRDQEEDIKYSPFARDDVLIDPGLEFRRSKYAINDMLGPSAAMQRRLNPVAAAAADEEPINPRQRRRTSARLRALARRMGLRGGLLMPRRSVRISGAGSSSEGAGPSSFGMPRYITVKGRKRRLYKGLYGGVYYKNTYGTKIYLKPKNKIKIIKSADGISVTGWKNILDFYEKSNHKITWVHSPTRVLKMIKIGDMIEFTVKTDDSGEMYTNYLDIIVSPDDDGNYPVLIDGKKYLVAGNLHDAKNTFSYVSAAPDVFNPGRSWYVYKFKTRINLTEV